VNPYLEPPGIFGTGASLLADLTLIAYIAILIPAMLIGYSYARRGKHRPEHRWVMTGVTIANWLLIAFLMIAAYRFDVADNISRQPGNLRYLLPTIHGILGLPAQLFATLIVGRMLIEDRAIAAAKRRGETQMRPYFWKIAKPMMQVTLALWLATSALGIASYVIRYNVIQTPLALGGDAPGNVQPVVTPELVSTPEVEAQAPVATSEVQQTAEAAVDATALPARIMALVQTEEVAATPEVSAVTATPPPTRRVQAAATPEVMSAAGASAGRVLAALGMRLREAGLWLFTRLDIPRGAAAPEVVMTPEAAATPEGVHTPRPPRVAVTPEVVSTSEAQDESGQGRGRGRGRGRGGDDDN
jgi:hypothetical protein